MNSSICPKCGADREAVRECLYHKGLAREQAICIIENCLACRDYFSYLPALYSQLEIVPIPLEVNELAEKTCNK